jgi:hypothetical protein
MQRRRQAVRLAEEHHLISSKLKQTPWRALVGNPSVTPWHPGPGSSRPSARSWRLPSPRENTRRRQAPLPDSVSGQPTPGPGVPPSHTNKQRERHHRYRSCTPRTRIHAHLTGSPSPDNATPSIGETVTSPEAHSYGAYAAKSTAEATTATSNGSGPPANNAGTKHASSWDFAHVDDRPSINGASGRRWSAARVGAGPRMRRSAERAAGSARCRPIPPAGASGCSRRS